jgi:hypothetical protein
MWLTLLCRQQRRSREQPGAGHTAMNGIELYTATTCAGWMTLEDHEACRRKRNRAFAQESRRNKKAYVAGSHERLVAHEQSVTTLTEQLQSFQAAEAALRQQLRSLQASQARVQCATQPRDQCASLRGGSESNKHPGQGNADARAARSWHALPCSLHPVGALIKSAPVRRRWANPVRLPTAAAPSLVPLPSMRRDRSVSPSSRDDLAALGRLLNSSDTSLCRTTRSQMRTAWPPAAQSQWCASTAVHWAP